MKPMPLLSTDSPEEARRKLQRLFPDANEEDEHDGSAVRRAAAGKRKAAVGKGAVGKPSLHGDDDDDDEGEGHLDEEGLFDATNDTLRDIAGGGAGAILEQVESDDEDEIGDRVFKETDLVFAVAAADHQTDVAGGSSSRLELYTYDEPEDNMFIHHDMELAAFPLCTAWLTDGMTSMMAVGTMLPFIEIWALDVMDSVAPMMLLGGCEKLEDNYVKKRCKTHLKPESHTDAVLSVSWNSVAQNIVVSGSADHTIKLWDLNVSGGACLGTYRENEKVQSLCFHQQDPNLLLSGGFDAVMRLRDCRQPTQNCHRMSLHGEVIEHVEFVPEVSHMTSSSNSNSASTGPVMQVMASTSQGTWAAFDIRQTSQPLWHLRPHTAGAGRRGGGADAGGGETTFSCSLHVPGLYATGGGKDGMITLWDGRAAGAGAAPQAIVSRDYKTGGVLSLAFHPNSPHILGACGMKGEPLVYTMTEDLKGKW